AQAIGTRAIAGGRSVELAHVDRDKARRMAARLAEAASADTVGTAALDKEITGEIVVLAVPYEAVPDVLQPCGDGLAGRIVVDISNPVDWSPLDRLVTPPGTSAAEETAALVPVGTAVVKAFNTTFAGILQNGQVAGQPLDVFVAGDDPTANRRVADLV